MAADIKEALIQYCDVKQEYDDIRTRRDTLKRDIERMEKEQISVIDSVTGGNGGIQHYKIEGYPYPNIAERGHCLWQGTINFRYMKLNCWR